MKLHVRLLPGEDGYIVAECPALPGCISQGRTRDEAVTNIREAIEAWIEVHDERIGSPPEDSSAEVIEVAV